MLSMPEYAVVRWTTPEGFEGVGQPLPRERAEAVAAAFARLHPDERTWLEPLEPPSEPPRHAGD